MKEIHIKWIKDVILIVFMVSILIGTAAILAGCGTGGGEGDDQAPLDGAEGTAWNITDRDQGRWG